MRRLLRLRLRLTEWHGHVQRQGGQTVEQRRFNVEGMQHRVRWHASVLGEKGVRLVLFEMLLHRLVFDGRRLIFDVTGGRFFLALTGWRPENRVRFGRSRWRR